MKTRILILLLGILLTACGSVGPSPAVTPSPTFPLPGTKSAPPLESETPLAVESTSPTAPPESTNTSQPTATLGTTDTPVPPASPTASPPLKAEAQPVDLKFTMADDVKLAGTLYLPQDSSHPLPGVILLPMHVGKRQDWAKFASEFSQKGYAVLALDMRGCGDSEGTQDWTKSPDDIKRVWQQFVDREDVDSTDTAIVGASLGANMALITAANQPEIRAAVLLSPGLDYRGAKTEPAMAGYGQRHLLIVASEKDPLGAAGSSRTLWDLAQGKVQLLLYPGAAHGTYMFASDPELSQDIQDWLAAQLSAARPTPTPGGEESPVVQPVISPALINLVMWVITSLLCGILPLILAGLLAYNASKKQGARRRPDQVSLSAIASLKAGQSQVRVAGTIESVLKPLEEEAESSADLLAVLRLRIEEQGLDGSWKVLLDETRAAESFILKDKTGSLPVFPGQPDGKFLGKGFSPSREQLRAALKILGRKPDLAEGERLRAQMWELRQGQDVTVTGSVRQGELFITHTDGQPVAISPLGETLSEIAPEPGGRSSRTWAVVFTGIGAIMMCYSLIRIVQAFLLLRSGG